MSGGNKAHASSELAAPLARLEIDDGPSPALIRVIEVELLMAPLAMGLEAEAEGAAVGRPEMEGTGAPASRQVCCRNWTDRESWSVWYVSESQRAKGPGEGKGRKEKPRLDLCGGRE